MALKHWKIKNIFGFEKTFWKSKNQSKYATAKVHRIIKKEWRRKIKIKEKEETWIS